MGKLFHDLVILTRNKEILFEQINDKEFCADFFSRLLSVFEDLTKHVGEGELSNIHYGNKKVNIQRTNDLIFLTCCDPETKKKKIDEEMEKITTPFFEIYSKVLISNFKDDRSIFKNSEIRFQSEISNLIDIH